MKRNAVDDGDSVDDGDDEGDGDGDGSDGNDGDDDIGNIQSNKKGLPVDETELEMSPLKVPRLWPEGRLPESGKNVRNKCFAAT